METEEFIIAWKLGKFLISQTPLRITTGQDCNQGYNRITIKITIIQKDDTQSASVLLEFLNVFQEFSFRIIKFQKHTHAASDNP